MEVQPLRMNIGGYRGAGLDLDLLHTQLSDASHRNGWKLEFLPCKSPLIPTLKRISAEARFNLYISAGIHGDEPAGPLAILNLISKNLWPQSLNLWVCPFLNPSGLKLNQRGNGDGRDLNRDYRDTKSLEVAAHKSWLERQPNFDLTLCLHEDWEARGFYVYELNPDRLPGFASQMIEAVRGVCPIDGSSEIDGWSAEAGIIRPDKDPFDRPEWPEALHLMLHKTRQSYTLEAPSDFSLNVRVAALGAALDSVIHQFERF